MNDHLGKPFKRDELLRVVERWAGARAGDAPADGAERTATAPARPEGGGFDGGTYSEVIALVDERRRPALLDKFAGILTRWPDPAAAAAMDPEDLADRAHRLVSSAGLVGFEELSDLCRELEEACRQGGPEEALLADVETARRQALTQVTALKQAG